MPAPASAARTARKSPPPSDFPPSRGCFGLSPRVLAMTGASLRAKRSNPAARRFSAINLRPTQRRRMATMPAQRNKTGDDITAEVLQRFAETPDLRLRQIMLGLIKHLHAFVKEVELTEAEWFQAIEALTEAGRMCSDKRQEFILFSDTLGVSMVVDLISHRKPDGATEFDGVWPVSSARRARIAGGRQYRSSRQEGDTDPGQRPSARSRRKADQRRGTRCLAGAIERSLRFARCEPRRAAHAGQISHRRRGPLSRPHCSAGPLPDPVRWPGRPNAARDRPPSLAPRPYSLRRLS